MNLAQKNMLRLVGLVLLSGCGGGSSTHIEVDSVSSAVPHKISRNVTYYGDTTNLHVDIRNDENNYIFGYSNDTEHIQIYLDTDKNEASGYRLWDDEGIGADYLIEDYYIFRYTGAGATEWSWEYLGEISEQTGDYYAELPIDGFGKDVKSFTSQAISVDENWEAVFAKEDEVVTRVVDLYGDLQRFSITTAVAQDDLNIYFIYLENANPAHSQYFINIDLDEQTGYVEDDFILGAEYMIEDDVLFKYSLENESGWQWEYVRKVDMGVVYSDQYLQIMQYVAVPKSEVPEWNGMCEVSAIYPTETWERNGYKSGPFEYKVLNGNRAEVPSL